MVDQLLPFTHYEAVIRSSEWCEEQFSTQPEYFTTSDGQGDQVNMLDQQTTSSTHSICGVGPGRYFIYHKTHFYFHIFAVFRTMNWTSTIIMIVILILWCLVLFVFIRRWGKIRNLIPYQPYRPRYNMHSRASQRQENVFRIQDIMLIFPRFSSKIFSVEQCHKCLHMVCTVDICWWTIQRKDLFRIQTPTSQ